MSKSVWMGAGIFIIVVGTGLLVFLGHRSVRTAARRADG